VKELTKLAPLVQSWHLSLLGFVLAVVLLFDRIVDFNQALILILVAVLIDKRGRNAKPAPRKRKRTSSNE
jgi:isoprenylcysteine carboxyl methyltransferase (ICMT) family protein YpbQ